MKKLTLSQLRSIDIKHVMRRFSASFTEGWYFPGEEMSKDRARLVACNYTSNIIANFVGGSFWTGMLLLLGATDGLVGTMTMISTAANMMQMFSSLLLERFKRRKKLILFMRSSVYIINVLFIGLIPLFPLPAQGKLTLLALSVLLVNIISALISPGITVWHIQSIPNRVRPYYFSIITMTVGAVVAICNLAGSRLVDSLKTHGMEYEGLLTLRLVALALCAVEIVLYSRIKEYDYESTGSKFTLRDLFTKPFKEKIYLRTILVTFLWNISANTPGSYYTVYLLKNLNVSYSYITLISMINVPIVLLLTTVWRRKVLARFGWFKTLYISMLAYVGHYVLLALVTKETMWIYPLSQILGFTTAIGINLSFTGVPYINMPKQNQTVFIGFYSAMANFAALLGVTIGKYFIEFTENQTLTVFGFEMVNKQYLVLLTGFLVGLAALGIRWIQRTTKVEE